MTKIFITIICLCLVIVSFGQNIDNDYKNIVIDNTHSVADAYFLIKCGDKQMDFIGSKSESGFNILNVLEQKLIKSIDIYKGTKATEEFGDKGINGVVIIELKKGRLEKLPEEIQKQFIGVIKEE